MNEINYIAHTGDVVMMPSGAIATVTRANPVTGGSTDPERYGAYYDLLFTGGWEDTYYVWADAPDVMVRATPRSDAGEQALFTVLDVAALVGEQALHM